VFENEKAPLGTEPFGTLFPGDVYIIANTKKKSMEKILLKELNVFAKRVLERVVLLPQKAEPATVIALRGDLGAGKTTFVQALARELGIEETIQSPTYVLMKSYPISYAQFTKLIHIDAYRLENAKEFAALKPEQFLNDPQTLICIEWPERVEGALPTPDRTINFSSEGAREGERFVEVVV